LSTLEKREAGKIRSWEKDRRWEDWKPRSNWTDGSESEAVILVIL
jgi:hypothetical protein